jgi:hypothetical protein
VVEIDGQIRRLCNDVDDDGTSTGSGSNNGTGNDNGNGSGTSNREGGQQVSQLSSRSESSRKGTAGGNWADCRPIVNWRRGDGRRLP